NKDASLSCPRKRLPKQGCPASAAASPSSSSARRVLHGYYGRALARCRPRKIRVLESHKLEDLDRCPGKGHSTAPKVWRGHFVGGYPGCRLRKTLESGCHGSGDTVSWRVIIDSVTAADHERRLQSICKTKPRTKVLVIQTSHIPMTGAGINQTTMEVGKSGYLKRRCHTRIEIVHVVETLGARQADV